MVKIQAERLADMNLPRHGHSLLYLNGEPTAIGGHTTSFVPTPTLEYYKDGKWHLVQTAFTHDDGCAVQLTTGKVLIVGGHEKNLGVGQSFEAELYDPVAHTCEGFASLDTKRAKPSALAMDDGTAVIAGNWYYRDAIELYDGKESFVHVKDVSIARSTPHILRISRDDAIIVGSSDSIGRQITLPVVDRLRGEPYHVPLLESWKPTQSDKYWPASYHFIGDEAEGNYSYLLPVKNDEGQVAIARVTNGEFSLLPTDVPIPMSCQWGEIYYEIGLITDRESKRAYLLGIDSRAIAAQCDSSHIYVVSIDYAATPARVTLCYTDALNDIDFVNPLLTADGDLMLIGGVPNRSFFKPTAATWLLHVSPRAQVGPRLGVAGNWWTWAFIVLAIVALAIWLFLRFRVGHRLGTAANEENQENTQNNKEDKENTQDQEENQGQESIGSGEEDAELMGRICQLMEERQLYLNPNLKMTDIAKVLGTNRNVISNCINSQRDCSFPQFVNAYRVAHAQELMSTQPDLKIAEVCMAAGFSSEASFYRIFKSVTGKTPTDWRNNN